MYVLEDGSRNPGVPPNLDTPEGSLQAIPEASAATALEEGTTYHLVALADVGLPVTSCLFTYGEPLGASDAGTIDYVDPSVCDSQMTMFGTTCRNGVEDPSVCPEDWSCFDVSMFQAGAPSFCLAPPE